MLQRQFPNLKIKKKTVKTLKKGKKKVLKNSNLKLKIYL